MVCTPSTPSTTILMEVTPTGKSTEMQRHLVSQVPSRPPAVTRFRDLAAGLWAERDHLEDAIGILIEGIEN